MLSHDEQMLVDALKMHAERDEVQKLYRALRQKDEGMGVLFHRMREAGVDYSDLIP